MFSNEQIAKVHNRIKDCVVQTPCVFSPCLSELTGARVFLKLENMQKTGSFKERGALNFILSSPEPLVHIVAASAGNHAQAVALHAHRKNIKATIFMPESTPNSKIMATQRLNACVKIIGKNYDEAFVAASAFAKEHKAHYIHAYDDLNIICGQATIGLEILEQVARPDFIFIPVGGGGLISGIGGFIANLPGVHKPKIIGVESVDCASMALALNKPAKKFSGHSTIAEGIAVKNVSGLTMDICSSFNPDMVQVSDPQIQHAIMLMLEKQKIVTEGAGASVVAALISDEWQNAVASKTVVLVISGGNIDTALLERLSSLELVHTGRMCKITLVVKDCPGSLASLLNIISGAHGNIIDIKHERIFAKLRWNEVSVELIMQTKDEVHEGEILSLLQAQGFLLNKYL